MLAARFVEAGKPFAVEKIDIPDIEPDDVLVEIKASGICGTDVHYYTGEFSPYIIPLTLGHEGAGVVKEAGSNVTHIIVGDHVVIHYIISCGNCKPCMQGYDNRCRHRQSIGSHVDGTFAEYIKVPARSALKMADNVPFEWGAIAACAVSTPYHSVKISGLKAGDTALVFGVGGVGLHAVMWAKFFGAGKVMAVDVIDSKLEEAQRYGADLVVNTSRDNVLEAVEKATDGWGVDVAIECSGSPKAMEQAIKAIKGRNRYATGTAVSVGLQTTPLQAEYWGLREGRLMVSGDHTRFELQQIIQLMEARKIDLSQSITHRIPLQDVNEGVELVESGREHVERVVIDMTMK
jgi:2-desacetyl-2-hydroxyethyl bacteriochlorophyllide A dehydrogenase